MPTVDEKITEEKLTEIYLAAQHHAEHAYPAAYPLSCSFADGLWRDYRYVETVGYNFSSAVVLDFGCKYGHLLPFFLYLGATKAIGCDAVEEYLVTGGALFAHALGKSVEYIRTENGLIPLQPETVDFVLCNEVISHINPSYLDMVYAEFARVLKPGGVLLISDGNNWANTPYKKTFSALYAAWENGPDGVVTDRDVVTGSFLPKREEIIRQRHPAMDEGKVRFLAENTSLLFGTVLERIVDEYARTGELIRRPYNGGTPVNPEYHGSVMERGFHPEHIRHNLEQYNFEVKEKPVWTPHPTSRFRSGVRWLRALRSQHLRCSQGFIVFAEKRGNFQCSRKVDN